MARAKDPYAVQVGMRIRQARQMAGYDQATDFIDVHFPDWTPSRLSNYELGTSLPHPSVITAIADATHTSRCWLMFGDGPIGANSVLAQTVRHQNLARIAEGMDAAAVQKIAQAIGETPAKLQGRIDNPFKRISDRLARRVEKALGKPARWLDEQHIDYDPMFDAFPADMRALMMVYDEMSEPGRRVLLAAAQAIQGEMAS